MKAKDWLYFILIYLIVVVLPSFNKLLALISLLITIFTLIITLKKEYKK